MLERGGEEEKKKKKKREKRFSFLLPVKKKDPVSLAPLKIYISARENPFRPTSPN